MPEAVGYRDDITYEAEYEPSSGLFSRLLAVVARRPLATAVVTLVVGASVVIVANAVFLQSEDHPSPFFETREDGGEGPAVAEDGVAAPAVDRAPGDDEIGRLVEVAAANPEQVGGVGASVSVVRAQQLLAALGYDPGTVDGLFGARTAAAIEAFERDQGVTPTGEVSEALIQRLEAATPEQAAAVDVEAETTIIAVQSALNRAGYGPVAINGELSDETASAIRSFQLSYGLDITGVIDRTLVDRLTTIGAMEPL